MIGSPVQVGDQGCVSSQPGQAAFVQLGIAGERFGDGVYRYPDGYVPWSTPEQYDTRQPGLSNRGHEREFAGLSDVEKRALIEYLKTL